MGCGVAGSWPPTPFVLLLVPWEGPGVVAHPSTNRDVWIRVGVVGLVARHPFFYFFLGYNNQTVHFLKFSFLTKGVILTKQQFHLESG